MYIRLVFVLLHRQLIKQCSLRSSSAIAPAYSSSTAGSHAPLRSHIRCCLPLCRPQVTHFNTECKIILVVYVTNITTAASSSNINKYINHQHSSFQVTVNGSLEHIIASGITNIPDGREHSHQCHIHNILSRFGMPTCRPVSRAFYTKTFLVKASDCDPVLQQNFDQRMIASLM